MTDVSNAALNKLRFDREAHNAEVAQHRRATPADPVSAEVRAGLALDEQARRVAKLSEQAACAVALMNASIPVVPIDYRGTPAGEVCDGWPEVIRRWGNNPHLWPGTPAGKSLVVAALDDDAWEWLKEAAAPDDADPDRAEVEPSYRHNPKNYRAHQGVSVLLAEPKPAPEVVSRLRVIPLPRGDQGDALAEKLRRPPSARTAKWLVWSGWPAGWKPPNKIARLKTPFDFRPALPCEGAILEWKGEDWRVSTTPVWHHLSVVPEWLAIQLGAKGPEKAE